MADCGQAIELCRNKHSALHLKVAAIVAILCSSALGVGLPLIGRKLKFLRTDSSFFFVTKAFAAGVILATGFVHMLPDAASALTSPCLPEHPWAKFPWHGFIAMMASLFTLLLDFIGTEYYEKKHGISGHSHGKHTGDSGSASLVGSARIGSENDMLAPDANQNSAAGGEKVVDIESKEQEQRNGTNRGNMHIVGMRAHAASHSHSHPDGQHGVEQPHHHATGHNHSTLNVTEEEVSLRHVVISQVLELGIIAHSVIIGISLGVSQSPCTIRPLIAALVFHQFFEGFALGGCISQAGFKYSSALLMAVFFAVTTPFGISVGIGIASSYNDNSPHALIVEGLFDSISAGILVYMALVDLIAADFLSKRLRCDRQLQLFSYMALFTGAGVMSALAVWA